MEALPGCVGVASAGRRLALEALEARIALEESSLGLLGQHKAQTIDTGSPCASASTGFNEEECFPPQDTGIKRLGDALAILSRSYGLDNASATNTRGGGWMSKDIAHRAPAEPAGPSHRPPPGTDGGASAATAPRAAAPAVRSVLSYATPTMGSHSFEQGKAPRAAGAASELGTDHSQRETLRLGGSGAPPPQADISVGLTGPGQPLRMSCAMAGQYRQYAAIPEVQCGAEGDPGTGEFLEDDDDDADLLDLLREQQEMQSKEIEVLVEFEERRAREEQERLEELEREAEQLRLMRLEQMVALQQQEEERLEEQRRAAGDIVLYGANWATHRSASPGSGRGRPTRPHSCDRASPRPSRRSQSPAVQGGARGVGRRATLPSGRGRGVSRDRGLRARALSPFSLLDQHLKRRVTPEELFLTQSRRKDGARSPQGFDENQSMQQRAQSRDGGGGGGSKTATPARRSSAFARLKPSFLQPKGHDGASNNAVVPV